MTSGFAVTLGVIIGDQGPQAVRVEVVQPDMGRGTPVTSAALRGIAVDQAIKDGAQIIGRRIEIVDEETGGFRVEGVEGVWAGRILPHAGRQPGGARQERLARVAEIYIRALAEGRPPVKAVESELPCSRSHAGRLVGQARAEGWLRQTTPGRPSTVDLSPPEDVGPEGPPLSEFFGRPRLPESPAREEE